MHCFGPFHTWLSFYYLVSFRVLSCDKHEWAVNTGRENVRNQMPNRNLLACITDQTTQIRVFVLCYMPAFTVPHARSNSKKAKKFSFSMRPAESKHTKFIKNNNSGIFCDDNSLIGEKYCNELTPGKITGKIYTNHIMKISCFLEKKS